MNTLRKNIIYNYIIITFVLLAAEIYLCRLLFENIDLLAAKTGIGEIFFLIAGYIAFFSVFGLFSYGYYRRICDIVKEETDRQARERGVLFANIAHDLKNPISSVLGFARALESGAVEPEKQQTVYRTISAKSLQIDDMIQKMFRFAKLESDGYSLSLCERDICCAVRECAAARYGDIEARSIELDVDIPDTPVMKSIDSTEFSRLVENLVSNAIKHNDEGIKMLVSVSASGDRARVVIADSGSCIPEELRSSIFEPFRCSDVSRTTKDGSGLGLAIAKRIAELHGGRLYIDDNITGYTKAFVFEF
ncbi:MAG: HAMP domain-containing histidine kinase [Ruminococcaceae bacterium]|nr:HAMP domain-containing histidine kinase [Oscillospiraceae bacterium]